MFCLLKAKPTFSQIETSLYFQIFHSEMMEHPVQYFILKQFVIHELEIRYSSLFIAEVNKL